jgi:hypothetical protein
MYRCEVPPDGGAIMRLRPVELAQTPTQEDPMNSIYYIGFDIHKKTISFCAKAQDGRILETRE